MPSAKKHCRKTATELMWRAVDEDRREETAIKGHDNKLPFKFLAALRVALESGLSAEQMTASIMLTAGLYEALDTMSGRELIERCEGIIQAMQRDLDHTALERKRIENNRKRRKAKKTGIRRKRSC